MIAFDCQRVFQLSIATHKVFIVLHNKSLNDWSLGKQLILLSSNLSLGPGSAVGVMEDEEGGKKIGERSEQSGGLPRSCLLHNPNCEAWSHATRISTLRFSGNKINCFPQDQSLSVK